MDINLNPSKGLQYTLNADGVSYSVTGIGNCADTHVVIPSTYEGKPVTGIGEQALICGKMESITIPDSITSVGQHAFFLCESLKKVTVGKGVTSWGEGALHYCASLEAIAVDKNNPTFHSASNCLIETATKTVIQGCNKGAIPNDGSITKIGAYAFAYYPSIENAVIPDGVTVVDAGAYYGCTSLKNITITASVEDMRLHVFDPTTEIHFEGEADAFYRATRYAEIEPDTTTHLYINGVKTSITMGELTEEYKKKRGYSDGLDYTLNPDEQSLKLTGRGFCLDKDIVIPSKMYGKPVTEIGWGAFAWQKHITSITIPNSITSIGYDAFYNCTSLTDIYYQGTASDLYNLIKGQRLPLETQLHFAGGAACTVGELEAEFDIGDDPLE